LRTRGSRDEYSAERVGWILKKHGFDRDRSGPGRVVHFSGENTLILHQLARNFGLGLPKVQDCPRCAEPKVIVAQ